MRSTWEYTQPTHCQHTRSEMKSKHLKDKADIKALPTCDLSHNVLRKLFNVLEVCSGACMQNREGRIQRKGIQGRERKKMCGNIRFSLRTILARVFFFSTLVGYSLQVKVIQHAQADHPLSLAQLLLGWGFYTFCEFFTCLGNDRLVTRQMCF